MFDLRRSASRHAPLTRLYLFQVEGNMFMVYNMGTADHPIGDISVRVNDNQYHVVRFTRSGANSTIQLDDYNVQTQHPPGHQLSVFNSQAKIQVGGRWSAGKKKVERAFSGVISGLVFNGIRVLDLAAAEDRRTLVRGDVQVGQSRLSTGPPRAPPLRLPIYSPLFSAADQVAIGPAPRASPAHAADLALCYTRLG